MNILSLVNFDETETAQLTALPGVKVISANAFASYMASDIDVIVGWSGLANTIISQTNHVKYIQTQSAGVDYLPLAEFAKQNIQLGNASGIHGDAIAQTVLGYVLDFARGITEPNNRQPDEFWLGRVNRQKLFTLTGHTAMVFGAGHVGQAIGKTFQNFGVTTVGVNTHGTLVSGFDRVVSGNSADSCLPDADFVINALPLTPETEHMYNAAFFAKMKASALFINIGRGPSMDTAALIDAITTGTIGGAALDVFEDEPLPATSPLWQTPNLIMTPHTSGTVDHIKPDLLAILVPNVAALLNNGAILKNKVNLDKGY